MNEIFSYIFSNIGDILGTTFLYGFLGFALPLIGLFLLKRKNLLKRRFLLNRIVVGIFFLYIPLVLGFTSLAWGGVKALKKNAIHQVDAVFDEVSKTTLPALQTFVSNNTHELQHEKITNEAIVDRFITHDGSVEETSLTGKLIKWTLMGVLSYVESEVVEKTSDITGMNESNVTGLTEGIINLDAAALHQVAFGMVEKVIHSQISIFFAPYQMIILSTFLITMFLPFLELTICCYKAYKRKQKIQPKPVET